MTILDVRGLEAAACPCYAIDKKIYSRILGRKARAAGRRRSRIRRGATRGRIAVVITC